MSAAEGSAAAADGIVLRELRTPDEMRAVVDLQWQTWGQEDSTPANQLIVSVKIGGHVLGAFDGPRLVGFAYAFPAVLPGREPWLQSHMLATRRGYDGRGIGRRLKWLQRDWALARGFHRITWTFDPLEARNAHLNLNVLGATAPEYVVNCYGDMDDRLNRGLPSDRLVASWDLESERVALARAGHLGVPRGEGVERVGVPRDLQALKADSLARAMTERLRVRDALRTLMARGLVVSGFDREACALVLTPGAS